jgi:hypothetical protein
VHAFSRYTSHGTEAMSGLAVLNRLSGRGLELQQQAMEVSKIEFWDHQLSSDYGRLGRIIVEIKYTRTASALDAIKPLGSK